MNRYDQFQVEAVARICSDFQKKPDGRYLLVVPTGGGKTFTAVRAVNRSLEQGILPESSRVAWVAHRTELLDQARATFDQFSQIYNDEPNYADQIDYLMTGGIRTGIGASHALVVIDEAHHGAAASYQPIFERSHVGVLGLTATPSRHDGKPLPFDRESYSIGFPDLVDIGVLIRPQIVQVEGGRYDIDDLTDGLEALNNSARNSAIIQAIADNENLISKAIVYVGTVEHAEELYGAALSSDLAFQYENIAFITGGKRRRYAGGVEYTEDRSEFIDAIKSSDSALIINVDVLTEGYDDAAVNCVVMARPTQSKLVYMQAMGRAVRRDPNNSEKQAFVIEVIDELPNIRYRIDNRWLYSDVSDVLEPAVVDREFATTSELYEQLTSLYQQFNVPKERRSLPKVSSSDRVSLLLFREYQGPDQYAHVPIVISNNNRTSVSAFFNFLSARMAYFDGKPPRKTFNAIADHLQYVPELQTERSQTLILHAMENAWQIVQSRGLDEIPEPVREGYPWITFVAFRRRQSAIDPDLEAFVEGMVNREEIQESLLTAAYLDGHYLVKLPLPLSHAWGMIIPPDEFAQLQHLIDSLCSVRDGTDPVHQLRDVTSVLDTSILPIEQRFRSSCTTIVREDLEYFRRLQR